MEKSKKVKADDGGAGQRKERKSRRGSEAGQEGKVDSNRL